MGKGDGLHSDGSKAATKRRPKRKGSAVNNPVRHSRKPKTPDTKTLASLVEFKEKLEKAHSTGQCPDFWYQAGLEILEDCKKRGISFGKDMLSKDGATGQEIEEAAKEVCQRASWPEQICCFREKVPHVSGTSMSPFLCTINGLEEMTKAQAIYVVVHEAGHGRDKLLPSKMADPLDASYRSVSSYILLEGLNDMLAFNALENSGYTQEAIIQGLTEESLQIHRRSVQVAQIAHRFVKQAGLRIEDINSLSQSDAQVTIAHGLGLTTGELDQLFAQELVKEGLFTEERLRELEEEHQEDIAAAKDEND